MTVGVHTILEHVLKRASLIAASTVAIDYDIHVLIAHDMMKLRGSRNWVPRNPGIQ